MIWIFSSTHIFTISLYPVFVDLIKYNQLLSLKVQLSHLWLIFLSTRSKNHWNAFVVGSFDYLIHPISNSNSAQIFSNLIKQINNMANYAEYLTVSICKVHCSTRTKSQSYSFSFISSFAYSIREIIITH